MHISIKFCLDFFITSRSIHVVLIGFQYIFVSFRILVYFVSLRFVSHFGIFRFVAFRFSFQYISLRFVSFRFVSFVAFRFRFVVQYNPGFLCEIYLFQHLSNNKIATRRQNVFQEIKTKKNYITRINIYDKFTILRPKLYVSKNPV